MFKRLIKSSSRFIGSISAVAVEGFKEGYNNPYPEPDVIDVEPDVTTI